MRTWRKARKESGNVLVEFSLSLAVLVPLFLGAWSYGYTFFQYSQLGNAVRSGARFASLQTYDSATTTPSDAFLTAVQKMTVYGDPAADAATATPVVAGLTTANVQLGVTFASGAPTAVTVSIKNFNLRAFTGSVSLNNKPYVWFPFVGTFGPP
jgi:Flp pilus assembly protein TadG